MDNLDKLLIDWAERQEPMEAHFEALRRRVRTESNSRAPSMPLDADRQRRTGCSHGSRTNTGRRGTMALICSVALVLATCVWFPGGATKVDNDVSWQGSTANTVSSTDEQTLFHELNRMFGRQWRSFSDINGQIDVQTATPNESNEGTGLAVHYTVLKRALNGQRWEVVWDASILTYADEWVQSPTENASGASLGVWSHQLPDGAILIENELTLTTPVSVKIHEPQVYRHPSKPTRLWSGRGADGEFQLIQSISRMESNRG